MPEVIVDGASVNYEVRAGGPQPVVFFHGGFGSSSQLWDRTMASLPPYCTGYAVNNFIKSDPPPDGYSVEAFARRAVGFIRALGLRNPVLVGHSMGGVVCQLTALRAPDLIGGLVLVCTGAAMRNHALGRELLQVLETDGLTEKTVVSISANWFHRDPPPGFLDEYLRRAKTVPVDAMISVQASLLAANLEPRLHEIRAPTLVVWAAHDTGRTFDYAETLLRGIPVSRLARMENSGHSPMVETPAEFDQAFHTFLREIANMHFGADLAVV
jgi:pimeloyl-ACP methyl ester carboxylesterase